MLNAEQNINVEYNRQKSLHEARNAGEAKKAEKAIVREKRRDEGKSSGLKKNITKAFNLMACLREMSIMQDMPFIMAFMFAIIKDILDGVLVGLAAASGGLLLPLVIILCYTFSILCSIFIFIEMITVRATEHRKTANRMATKIAAKAGSSQLVKKWTAKFVVFALGSFADSIPALNVLPIETLTVLIIYILVLADRANERTDEKYS